jgi:phosphopantetheinyl transferase
MELSRINIRHPNVCVYIVSRAAAPITDHLSSIFQGDIEICKDHFGKPFLANNGHTIPFSLAKSNHWEVFAFSKDPHIGLGIDIEFMKPRHDGFRKKFMSKPELTFYDGIHTEQMKAEYFYKIFSMKEAIFKSTGKGLSGNLSSLCINSEIGSLPDAILSNTNILGESNLMFQTLQIKSYVISGFISK